MRMNGFNLLTIALIHARSVTTATPRKSRQRFEAERAVMSQRLKLKASKIPSHDAM